MTEPITEAEWEATIASDRGARKANGHRVNGAGGPHLRIAREDDQPAVNPATAPRELILRGLLPAVEDAVVHWGDPEPIGPQDSPPQPFPDDVLPTPVNEFAHAVAAHTQTPLDMVAMQILATLSTAAANRRWAHGGAGWIEPLVLWTLTVLPPASRKSAVVAKTSGPLYALERDIRDEHRRRHHGKEDRLAIAQQRKAKLVADLSRTGRGPAERQNLEAELDAVNDDLERFTIPPMPQLLADDVTPEALALVLDENEGHIGILSAEGGVFASLTGRYLPGTPQLDLILKSYDGDPFRVNRVGRHRVLLEHPAVSIGLAIQPQVLHETTKTPALRQRGMMGRFSYALPIDTVGTRSVETPEMPEHFERLWLGVIADIVAFPVWQPGQPREVLQLDRDALARHHLFRQQIEPRLHEQTGDLGFMADWAGKHAGRVLRIAALLHLAAGLDVDRAVSLDTMNRAVAIGDWMLGHAAAVYGGWRVPEADLGPARVLEWVRREVAVAESRGVKLGGFTVKDIFEGCRGQVWCARAEDAKDAAVALVRSGWLLSVERRMSDGKRRASAGVFVAHPQLLEAGS